MAQSTTSSAFDTVTRNVSTGSHLREGEMTKRIEEQTAKIPSVGYLTLAIGSMIASGLIVSFARRKELANFVGLWAPSFLLLGIYNKLVKLEGSDFSQKESMK